MTNEHCETGCEREAEKQQGRDLRSATSEEGDVKKLSSLQEIPSLLCYCMWAPCKSCSEEMDHLLLNSIILPLPYSLGYSTSTGRVCGHSLTWHFPKAPRVLLAALMIFPLDTQILMENPWIPMEASSSLLTLLSIFSIKRSNTGRSFGWGHKSSWT